MNWLHFCHLFILIPFRVPSSAYLHNNSTAKGSTPCRLEFGQVTPSSSPSQLNCTLKMISVDILLNPRKWCYGYVVSVIMIHIL